MALALSVIVEKIIIKVSDIARSFPNERVGTGDGSTTIFYLLYFPVKADSQTVYIDGVEKTETTHYTIDDDMGRITFVSAPASSEVITADYIGLHLSDSSIEDICELGIEELATIYPDNEFTVVAGNISPEPTQPEKILLIDQCALSVVEAEMRKAGREGIRTARTGISIDTSARGVILQRIYEILSEQLLYKAQKNSLRLVGTSTDDKLKR